VMHRRLGAGSISPGLMATLCVWLLIGVPWAVHGQSTVGNWDLSSWNYSDSSSPFSIATSTIQSNGVTPVGISSQATATLPLFITGMANGTTTEVISSSVPAFSPNVTYDATDTLTFSTGVNFGASSSQSQFSGTGRDNGVGVDVTTESSQFISKYDITFTLEGTADFTAFGDSVDSGFGSPVGLGTNTVTYHWLGDSTDNATALFDGIEISGNVTSFGFSEEIIYDNSSSSSLNPVNRVALKLNTIPEPQGATLLLAGGLSLLCAHRQRSALASTIRQA
jgi:hypothetical protein